MKNRMKTVVLENSRLIRKNNFT